MIDFKGSHFEREIVPVGVRRYVAYPISHRQLEEMMEERGVKVDHSSLNRWVIKYVPLLVLGLSQTEAPCLWQLAHGRNLGADQRPVEVFCTGP
jgi:transposase-like protein